MRFLSLCFTLGNSYSLSKDTKRGFLYYQPKGTMKMSKMLQKKTLLLYAIIKVLIGYSYDDPAIEITTTSTTGYTTYKVESLVPETGATHNTSYKGYKYIKSTDGYFYIRYYGKNKKTVTPPSVIDYGGKNYPIYEMYVRGDGSYGSESPNSEKIIIPEGVLDVWIAYFPNVTEIVLPKSLRKVRICQCPKLSKLVLPDGLKIIDYYGGYAPDLYALKEIVFPPSLEELGGYAFYRCGLKDVTIPSTVKFCQGGIFQSCTSLTNAYYNPSYTLCAQTFQGCTSLEKVEVGDAVIGICRCCAWYDQSAFKDCSALKDISLGVKINGTLTEGLCAGLSSLTNFVCKGAITKIGNDCFSGAKKLKNFKTAGNILSIGNDAFRNCYELENLNFEKCQIFGESACRYCRGFSGTLSLPSATSIGSFAFADCTGIKNLLYHNKMTSIPSYSFYNCSGITNIQLSSSLKRIENYAFQQCSKLSKLVIPENVTYIGTNSFQNCSSLKNVIFKGRPPSAYKAFSSIASSPYGYYMPKYRNEWKTVIGSDGKWNGLIMAERPAPILSVDSANIPYDELTLKWTCSASDENIVYSLYRNTTDDFSTATCIGEGEEFNKKLKMNGNTYVENKFMEIKPQTASLHYWIVAKDVVSGETETDHIETRRRFLMTVGYSTYGGYWESLIHKGITSGVYEIIRFRSFLSSYGGFSYSGERTKNLTNANATTQTIKDTMQYFSDATQPGDIFIFYIATHGGDYDEDDKKQASLLTYDGSYSVYNLLNDVRKFSSGTAIAGIIYACHSYSLTGSANLVNEREWINNFLTKCGFDQCLGNVSWITSCSSTNNSYFGEQYTDFGQAFVMNGMQYGFADKTLTLLGNKYNCSDKTNDGLLDFLELGRYAKIFAVGRSDNEPSEVCLENEGLLSRIVINKRSSSPSYNQPVPPASVSASQGVFDMKIDVNWDKVSSAQEYHIYRSEIGETSIAPKLVTRCYSNSITSYSDIFNYWWEVFVQRQYKYYVQSVNPLGTSALSSPAIAWRGTETYKAFLSKFLDSLPGDDSSSIETLESKVAANGYTFADSYVAGLNPTNETSKFTVNLSMKDGKPFVEWSPNLNTNGMIRNYIIWGKTNLTDEVWHSPTNDASRFFKVTVQLPEENE